MKKKNKYVTEHNYIGFEDLLQKLGYRRYIPKLGSLGKALLEASKNQRSNNFLKKYWDSYFRKLRQEKKRKNEFQKQDR